MEPEFVIILFYRFTHINDPAAFRDQQRELCQSLGLRGRLLIASEGLNGTFEGERAAINEYEEKLRSLEGFSEISFKESAGTGTAFTKLEIKVRREIVTLGVGDFDIAKETAKELPAAELEAMYERNEEFYVLDLRNDFELKVGQFDKTVDPGMRNFRDLPELLPKLQELKDKKVVAVCTGGIRCEKATCLLQREGFSNLYQLKDGIHTYMQAFPNSHFKGSLFVFDNRMTTPVVDAPGREIIGRCAYCSTPCEQFYSDDSVRPSLKVICCHECFEQHSDTLRSCSPAVPASAV